MITNGPSDLQRFKIEVLGIESWFDAIVVSGEIGIAKPDPAVFQVALSELNLDAEDVWHIGDNVKTDVGSANAAGLCSVWLNRFDQTLTEDEPVPDIEVKSLAELAGLLGPVL